MTQRDSRSDSLQVRAHTPLRERGRYSPAKWDNNEGARFKRVNLKELLVDISKSKRKFSYALP